jgi:hypothetical protein
MYQYGHSPDGTQKGYVNYTLTAFNTARWAPHVSDLPWPGPVHDDRSKYDNFTCFFKAFRESAPSDLSLSTYWGYPKDMEWMFVIAIKLAFIAVFEVFKVIFKEIQANIFSMSSPLLSESLRSAFLMCRPASSFR